MDLLLHCGHAHLELLRDQPQLLGVHLHSGPFHINGTGISRRSTCSYSACSASSTTRDGDIGGWTSYPLVKRKVRAAK
jgi:hypothetical protein